MKVYWEMTAARFFILGVIIFSLLLFIQPFIGCWLGQQYQMDEIIVYLLIFNLFIRLQPAAVYIFIGASGLYDDVWAAWVELILNLLITLLLAPIYGIIGILLGKIISFSLISFFWKPFYLFSQGFHKSVWEYDDDGLHAFLLIVICCRNLYKPGLRATKYFMPVVH